MKKLLLLPALLIVVGALTPVPAQRYPVFQSELKRIFEDKEFDPAEPRGFHWLPDGASFSMLQLQDDSTILVCRTQSGECGEKINAKVPIESYQWSPDGRKLWCSRTRFETGPPTFPLMRVRGITGWWTGERGIAKNCIGCEDLDADVCEVFARFPPHRVRAR